MGLNLQFISTSDIEKTRRITLATRSSLALGLIIIPLAIFKIIDLGVLHWVSLVAVFTSLFLICLSLLARWTGSYFLVAFGLSSLPLVIIPLVALKEGGLSSLVIHWLISVPLLAFILLGPVSGVLFGFLAISDIIILLFLHKFSPSTIEYLPVSQPSLGFRVTHYSAMILFSGILGFIFENGRKNAEEKYRSSKEEAEAASRIKAQFLANMSHEIRTPMNGIIGVTNLLLSSTTDSILMERLNIIYNCGSSLLHLIDGILDFSKLEVDKIEIEKEPFSIHEAITEIIELFTIRASEKGILFSYHYNPKIPDWIIGDVNRFRQVLTNLVSNAIKFTERGNIYITTQVDKMDGGALRALLSIKDSGIGIPDHLKSKLFLSFSQVDASTTRRFGGTGLGLAICKGLCEKMGGEIWVESKPGEGSTFFFYDCRSRSKRSFACEKRGKRSTRD